MCGAWLHFLKCRRPFVFGAVSFFFLVRLFFFGGATISGILFWQAGSLWPKSPTTHEPMHKRDPTIQARGSTLRRNVRHCNALIQKRASPIEGVFKEETLQYRHTTLHCNTQQHIATHCNTPQHTATHCNKLQPQHTAAFSFEWCTHSRAMVLFRNSAFSFWCR